MFISFLKLTLRNLLRQKFSSFINIFGLALGFASFIIIGLYVYDEMQYDRFHEKGDRVYRLYSNTFHVDRTMAHLPARFHVPLSENLPEAEAVVRIFSWTGTASIEVDNKTYKEPGLYFVDPAFFDVFSYSIKSGSLENFSRKPNSVLISSDAAHRFFGDEDPVGKLLRLSGQVDLEVAGVLEEYSTRSHFQFSMVANLEHMKGLNTFMFEDWGNYSSLFYLLLRPDADPPAVGQKIRDLMLTARGMEDKQQQMHFGLQPLKEVYLGSAVIETPFEMAAGSYSSVIIFSASALFILLLAGFNYVNLATAKSTSRAREVGIRKLLGAGRKQLVGYFLVESFLVCLIAMIVAFGLVEMVSPVFSDIAGKQISYSMIDFRYLIVLMIGLILVVSFCAGIYPAFIVSRFRPVNVLKGSASLFSGHVKGSLGVNLRLRQLLIILQFAISIGLVTASLVLNRQTSHAIANNGFAKDSLLVIRNNTGERMMSTYQGFKNQMSQYPFVTHVSAGGHVPTKEPGNQDGLRQPSQGNEERQLVYLATVDFD
ncbi:MAG: ABC transporter permease, partial [Bacteroidales bacterium]